MTEATRDEATTTDGAAATFAAAVAPALAMFAATLVVVAFAGLGGLVRRASQLGWGLLGLAVAALAALAGASGLLLLRARGRRMPLAALLAPALLPWLAGLALLRRAAHAMLEARVDASMARRVFGRGSDGHIVGCMLSGSLVFAIGAVLFFGSLTRRDPRRGESRVGALLCFAIAAVGFDQALRSEFLHRAVGSLRLAPASAARYAFTTDAIVWAGAAVLVTALVHAAFTAREGRWLAASFALLIGVGVPGADVALTRSDTEVLVAASAHPWDEVPDFEALEVDENAPRREVDLVISPAGLHRPGGARVAGEAAREDIAAALADIVASDDGPRLSPAEWRTAHSNFRGRRTGAPRTGAMDHGGPGRLGGQRACQRTLVAPVGVALDARLGVEGLRMLIEAARDAGVTRLDLAGRGRSHRRWSREELRAVPLLGAFRPSHGAVPIDVPWPGFARCVAVDPDGVHATVGASRVWRLGQRGHEQALELGYYWSRAARQRVAWVGLGPDARLQVLVDAVRRITGGQLGVAVVLPGPLPTSLTARDPPPPR